MVLYYHQENVHPIESEYAEGIGWSDNFRYGDIFPEEIPLNSSIQKEYFKMSSRVLVLNQDFSPLMVCSVERAFILVYLKKSELVRTANGHKLHSITQTYPMPSVIRLNRYVNAPYKGVNLTRQNIFKRDNNECQYCGTKKDLTIDHVTPRARGGKDTWTNLVTACKKCNAKKGEYTPEEANMPLKKKPYKPSYSIFLKDHLNGHGEWDAFLIENNH